MGKPEDILQTQPPVETTAPGEAEAGVVSPQLEAETVVAEPGAEKETPKPKRTYSQEEWSARESAKDKEISQHRAALNQVQQYYEAQLAQTAEAQAQAGDRRAVEAGEITEAEVSQRAYQRQQAYQQAQSYQQLQQYGQALGADLEEKGRLRAALDFGEKYGVDPKDLLGDKSLTTPPLMEDRAVSLRLEGKKAKLKAAEAGEGETFDSGQMGQASGSVSSMSPGEKILYGLAHPPRKTK